MLKKIIYIIICTLCLTKIEAQQQNSIKRLLQGITNEINKILIDSNVSAGCKENIERFKRTIPQKNSGNLRRSTIQSLINSSNTFKLSANTVYKKECNDARINNLIDTTKQLITELKKLEDSLNAVNKSPSIIDTGAKNKIPIPLTIKVIDSSTQKALNCKLNIDSFGTPITRLIKKDTGYFVVLLFPDIRYSFKVEADKYNSYNKEAMATNNQMELLIKLQKSQTLSEPSFFVKFTKENPLLLIALSLLFVLTLVVAILYIKTHKEFRSVIKIISDSTNNLKGNQSGMEENNINPEVSQSPAQTKKDQLVERATEIKEVISEKPKTDSYFVCEIMMTAGPRKKFMSEANADKDLGEDVCGFVSNTKEVWLWLLDGTSDSHCLIDPVRKREYFSSRLLAQCIADKLRKSLTEKATDAMDEIIALAVQEVKLDWQETIYQLPEEERVDLKKNIEDKKFPECSTTLLIGKLSINGDFTAYRSGDSKMFLFSTSSQNGISFVETPLDQKNEQSNDRIFFRLQLDENGKFDILFNKALNETIRKKNIHTIISFSDGIGVNTEQLLKEEYKNGPDKARKEIMYHLQGTGDDKSICFIEIKQTK